MQDKTRRSDQAVTAFFLNTGQSTEKLVGDVLAQAPPPVLSKLYDKHFGHEYRQGVTP